MDVYFWFYIRFIASVLVFIFTFVLNIILFVTRPLNGVTKFFAASTFFLAIHMVAYAITSFRVIYLQTLTQLQIDDLYYVFITDSLSLVFLFICLTGLGIASMRYDGS